MCSSKFGFLNTCCVIVVRNIKYSSSVSLLPSLLLFRQCFCSKFYIGSCFGLVSEMVVLGDETERGRGWDNRGCRM